MLDIIIEAGQFVAVFVLLFGVITAVKPFGPIRRRWQGLLIAVLAVGANVGLDAVPLTRPSNISPGAWADRTQVCKQAQKLRGCVKSDRDVAEARAEIADRTHAQLEKEQVKAQAAIARRSGAKYADADGIARKVSDTALTPYNPKDDADIYKTWGSNGVSRIERLRRKAADAVSKNAQCDQVTSVELADQRSKAPKLPVVFVDCANQQRFFIGESDLDHGIESEVDREKDVNDIHFYLTCSDQVQGMMQFPSTYKAHDFSKSATRDDVGNYGIVFAFEAKNGIGAELPYQARCILKPDGKVAVRIGPR